MRILRATLNQGRPVPPSVIAKKLAMDPKILWNVVDRGDLLRVRHGYLWATEKGIRVYLGRNVNAKSIVKGE